MGLLEYQTMPSLRDVAHDGVLCTFSNRSAPDRGKWCGPSIMYNHTLLGHSPPASQVGRRVELALSPSASLVQTLTSESTDRYYDNRCVQLLLK